jgi:lantibiotic biosynthesis protein
VGWAENVDAGVAVRSASLSIEEQRHILRRRLATMITRPEPPQVAAVAPPLPAPPVPARAAPVPGTFLPGSDWLYLKLYTGAGLADRLLRERLAPEIRRAEASRAIDRWFFLRYADPEFHLRLRLHGSAARLMGEVLPRLATAAERARCDGLLFKLELGTYEREIERYGGPSAIALAETVFAADSEAILALLETQPFDPESKLRWRLALYGLHRLFEDLGFALEERRTLLARLRAGFAHEHGLDGEGEATLGARFRVERAELETLLDDARRTRRKSIAPPLQAGMAALRARGRRVRPVARALHDRSRRGELVVPMGEIAESLLHMHVNRMLPSAARLHELVLYDFLYRLYDARLARARPRGAGAHPQLAAPGSEPRV